MSEPRRELGAHRRQAMRSARLVARRVLGRGGGVPAFLVIGGQRCGTTSLHAYLSAHPDVHPAIGKELQFFTLNWSRGPAWYRTHFPARGTSFESTPYYLFHPDAAERAAAVLPDVRLVALVRDPVARLLSHYRFNRARGLEPLALAGALDAEDRRTASGPSTRAHRLYSYRSRGFYAEQLDRWATHHGRDRLLVVRSEELFAAPASAYARVLAFLDLAPWEPASFTVHTRALDGDPDVSAPERAAIAAVFADANARLARDYDIDVSSWTA